MESKGGVVWVLLLRGDNDFIDMKHSFVFYTGELILNILVGNNFN